MREIIRTSGPDPGGYDEWSGTSERNLKLNQKDCGTIPSSNLETKGE
jgi:hypothetical protein